MRHLIRVVTVSFAFLVTVLAVGCGPKAEGIQTAKSVKIEYSVKGERKHLTVSDAKQVKEILDTISVHHTEDRAPGWYVWNNFYFILPDDKEIEMCLPRTQILDRSESGLIYLKDTKKPGQRDRERRAIATFCTRLKPRHCEKLFRKSFFYQFKSLPTNKLGSVFRPFKRNVRRRFGNEWPYGSIEL